MTTATGDESVPHRGERYGARYGESYAGDRPPVGNRVGDTGPLPGPRARPMRPPTLLSEIADLEPDPLTPVRRVGALTALALVVAGMAASVAVLIYAGFGLVG